MPQTVTLTTNTLISSAKRYFRIDIGTDLEHTFSVNNATSYSLNTFTATAGMKRHQYSSNVISLTCSINASANTLTLRMNHVESANLNPGRYIYDVKMTNTSNVVIRLVEGIITVNPAVTT